MTTLKPLGMGSSHMSSAAAFVQGGAQDACADSCSICLDPFCDTNPITVTSCKHGYHLQCILEWSQRSKDCPMCWQPLSLKDPNSQELLDAVEQERSFRQIRQVPSVFQRTSLEEFEFHVPAYAVDSDFEERIMQHLAAAAMGRAHHVARRENLRNWSSSGPNHPQFLVVPTRPPLSGDTAGGNLLPLAPLGPLSSVQDVPQDSSFQPVSSELQSALASHRPCRTASNCVRASELNRIETYPSRQSLEPVEESQQRTEPSQFHSFSESLRSRWAAASSRYKETFTKTTRGFRERLRARTNITDIGAHAREASAGVVRALERISFESTGRGRGDLNVRTVDDNTSDVEGCSTLIQATGGRGTLSGVNCGGTCTHANLSGIPSIVASQPPSNDIHSGFDVAFSKDIEGSSGGGANSEHTSPLFSPASM